MNNKQKHMGIYCITNKLNQKKYVGQSMNIELRWKKHIYSAFNKNDDADNYNYPLYRAMRKYGVENFEFNILETVSREMLDEKEIYWINKLNPEYNQTKGGGYYAYKSKKYKLNKQQVCEIQQILLNDTKCCVSHMELAKKYNVTKDTIQSINVGRTWRNSQYNYPLHYSKYDSNKPSNYYTPTKSINKCERCGKPISLKSKLCVSCNNEKRKIEPPSKKELQELFYIKTFIDIGKFFNVSSKTVRKWCRQYNLQNTYKEIHKKEPKTQKNKMDTKRPVKALSLTNDNIFIFQSISDAANWLIEEKQIKSKSSGIRSHISATCKGKRKTAYGFYWKYIDEIANLCKDALPS